MIGKDVRCFPQGFSRFAAMTVTPHDYFETDNAADQEKRRKTTWRSAMEGPLEGLESGVTKTVKKTRLLAQLFIFTCMELLLFHLRNYIGLLHLISAPPLLRNNFSSYP